jgi:hypothetical protein
MKSGNRIQRRKFNKGERLIARIIEVQAAGDLLCDVQGFLIRIQNQSQHQFKIGERLNLIVATEYPPTFKLAESVRSFERTV